MSTRSRQQNVAGGRPRARQVKLSEPEDQLLNAAAAAQRISVPAYMVEASLAAAGVPGESTRSFAASQLLRVERELSRIGNNVNQMARQMNTDGSVHEDLRATLAAVRVQIRRLERVSEDFISELRG